MTANWLSRRSIVAAAGLAPAAIPPRLLKEDQAAAYLGVPVAAMKRIMSGRVIIDGRVRWDRHALDAWLDHESGLGALGGDATTRTEAEAALDDWFATQAHAARRS